MIILPPVKPATLTYIRGSGAPYPFLYFLLRIVDMKQGHFGSILISFSGILMWTLCAFPFQRSDGSGEFNI